MSTAGEASKAQPIIKQADDEAKDHELTVQNLVNESYKEWPNEAGFDGLDEHRGPIEIPIKGTIPPWAAGSLYRTGPGQRKIENTPQGTLHLSHWFDGLAHTHRFDIVPTDEHDVNGEPKVKVLYSSRRQSDEQVAYIQKHGRGRMYSFGQRRDPCVGLFGKFMSVFIQIPKGVGRRLENVTVTVQPPIPGLRSFYDDDEAGAGATALHGHRAKSMWLTSDTCSMREIDAKTMEPIGFATQGNFHPSLTGVLSCAHPQRDPVTGDFFNVNLDVGRLATWRIFRTSASTGKTDIVTTIQRTGMKPVYMHSFFLSKSFVIICMPSTHLAWQGLKIVWEKNLLEALEPFDETKLCKWFVIDRHHGQGVVAEFETPAGFYFHTTNTFEETVNENGDTSIDLHCELVEYPNHDILRALYYDVMLDQDGKAKTSWGNADKTRGMIARLVRWKVRVPSPSHASGTEKSREAPVSYPKPEKILDIPGPHAGELPVINPEYHTKRHRYVYGLANRGFSTFADTIVKTDTTTRQAMLWNNPQGHTSGEPIFVPRPGTETEDDGVLLSVVLDGTNRTSYLLCLDAKTMTELGRAEMEFAVAFGFHGVHVKL